MGMLVIEQVVCLVEQYVKQLEGLAYSKNASMATRLVGAIDTGIHISQLSGDQWNRRVQVALNNVMADKPESKDLTGDLPPALANACTLPPPVQTQINKPVEVLPSVSVPPLPKV